MQVKANALRKQVGDVKFLPQLEKWLSGQGYMNPDIPVGAIPPPFPSRPTSRAVEADAEFLSQLSGYDVPTIERTT
jgi:hypothetical protein